MPLAFITPQSWTTDTDATIEIMNVYSNDLMFFNQRFGGSNIEWANVIVDDLLTLIGVNGIAGTPQTGILFQPTSFLASGTMYLLAHQMATDLYPRFAYNANTTDILGPSLVFGTGGNSPDTFIGRTTVSGSASQITFSFNYGHSYSGIRIVDNNNHGLGLFPETPASWGGINFDGDSLIVFNSNGLAIVPSGGSQYGLRMANTGDVALFNSLTVANFNNLLTANIAVKIYGKTLAAPAGTFTFGLSGTVRMLEIRINGASASSGDDSIFLQFNGSSTGYYDQWTKANTTTTTSSEHVATTSIFCGNVPGTGAPAHAVASCIIRLIDASTTAFQKIVHVENAYHDSNVSGGTTIYTIRGVWDSLSAVSSITVALTASNFAIGTSVEVWAYP